ncbi:hypothetical protein ACU8KH_05127 [Lachancea thermotolerans]
MSLSFRLCFNSNALQHTFREKYCKHLYVNKAHEPFEVHKFQEIKISDSTKEAF